MTYYIIFGIFGFVLIIFGLFFQKKKKEENTKIVPQHEAKRKTITDNSDQLHESIWCKKEEDKISEEERAEDNASRFIKNAKFERDSKHRINKKDKKAMEFFRVNKNITWPLREDEGVLTTQQEDLISEEYANTSWGWLIPTAASFSDKGKMRLPYGTLYYLSSKLNPVVRLDGSIEVVNMFNFEEMANIAIFTGKSFMIRDEKGIVKEITKVMIDDGTYPLSIQELISEYEKLKNSGDIAKKNREGFEESIKLEVSSMKSQYMLTEELNKEQIGSQEEELMQIKKLLKEREAEINRLLKEKVNFREADGEHSKVRKDTAAHSKIKEKSQPTKEFLHESEEVDPKKIKPNNPSFNENNDHAITHIAKKNTANTNNRAKKNSKKNNECDAGKFYENVRESYKRAVSEDKTAIFISYTGLITITDSDVQDIKNLLFEPTKLISFLKNWANTNNCDSKSVELNKKNYYFSNITEDFIFFGKAVRIPFKNLDVYSSEDLNAFTEGEVLNAKVKSVEITRAQEQINSGDIRELTEAIKYKKGV